MIFDSHAHYDDEAFDEDREEVIDKIQKAYVKRVINCGASFEGSLKSIELSKKYDFIYAAVGIHPEFASEVKQNLGSFPDLLKTEKVVAVGEIGLDYHYEGFDRETQIEAFKEQMDIAKNEDKPVIIHSREAFEDTLKVLKDFKGIRGVMHCFSGSKEYAEEVLKLGFYLGFTGVVTFKNAKKAVETIESMPLDRILVETDCPYMSPVPRRGERNDSSNLVYTISKIAEIKNTTYDEMCKITYDNASELFNIR